MKKCSMIVLAALALFGFSASVNAMTEDELEAKLTASYDINGNEISLRDTEKVLVEQYLAKNEISESDADYIASKVDEAIAILRNANVTNVNDLSSADKNRLVALVSDISENTAIKATVLSGGVLSIQNIDGTEFARVTKEAIRQTGNNNVLLITGIISLVGLAIAVGMFLRKHA